MHVTPEARAANRRVLRHLGFGRVPDDVGPVPGGPVRTTGEALDRAVVLHVVLAAAAGLDADMARRWLGALDLGVKLTPGEADYLADVADGIRVADAARTTEAEALAVLLWALGLATSLPLEESARWAPSLLPGPDAEGAALAALATGVTLRSEAELLAAHDLAAGMVWALRADPDLEVGSAPGSLDPYVVRQRHRAASWLLGAPWD